MIKIFTQKVNYLHVTCPLKNFFPIYKYSGLLGSYCIAVELLSISHLYFSLIQQHEVMHK